MKKLLLTFFFIVFSSVAANATNDGEKQICSGFSKWTENGEFKQVREIVTNPISVYQVPGQTNEVAAEQNEDWLKALDHQWDDNAGSIFNAWCSDVVYIGEINSQCSLRPDGQGEHSVPGSTIIIKPLSPAGTVPDNVVIKSNCPGVNQITQDSIDHFVNVCLGTELGGSPIVRRWESDVSIKVHFMDSAGEELPENPRDMRTVQNVIGDLNGLIDTGYYQIAYLLMVSFFLFNPKLK